MLPLKAGQTYTVEKDGVKYELRYLIGDTQRLYSDMLDSSAKSIREMGRIEKKLKTLSDNDVEGAEELWDRLASVNKSLDSKKELFINLFLVSINDELFTSIAGGLPLCDFLRPGDISKIVEVIQESLPVLAGTEVSEIKNSSRQPSSDSIQTESSTDAIDATKPQKSEGDA